jgi:methyl-accepting chemotaxis protein
MKKKFKRQKFPIIDRSLQYKFLAMILVYGVITEIFLAGFLFLPDFIALHDEDLSLEIRGAAADRVLTLHTRVWPAVLSLICLLGIHSFRVFLRLVGPLFRFRWAFEKLGKGELNFRVRLRKKDYLTQDAEIINGMIDAFNEKLGKVQLSSHDAVKSIRALEQSVKKLSAPRDNVQKLLKTHRKHLEDLVNQSGYFQLSSGEKEEQASSS